MSILSKIFGKKEDKKNQVVRPDGDNDLSDFNMFMDGGTDREDTDLNEIGEHLQFIAGGAGSMKRRL
jgi:hypothetical protein